jgi:8-oxo-dGTP diphosphatase
MPPDDSATRGPILLGPVGGYVIRGLSRLRGRLTYKELSDRLDQLGRPIPTLGLSRIERGNRRVDADDLIALAIALDVSPVELLLPPDAGPDDEVELTTRMRVPARIARDWLNGRRALPDADIITWPRRPGMHVVRESEIAEMRRRLDELEELAQVGNVARRHHDERKAREAPSIVAAIVTSPLGVLVGRRNDGTPPWTFIAGEQEPGERAEDTAVRETKEETGLRIQTGDLIGERVHPDTGRRMVYLAAWPTRGTDVFVGDEAELAEVRWVTLAEADELMGGMIYEPVREHLAAELGEA